MAPIKKHIQIYDQIQAWAYTNNYSLKGIEDNMKSYADELENMREKIHSKELKKIFDDIFTAPLKRPDDKANKVEGALATIQEQMRLNIMIMAMGSTPQPGLVAEQLKSLASKFEEASKQSPKIEKTFNPGKSASQTASTLFNKFKSSLQKDLLVAQTFLTERAKSLVEKASHAFTKR